MKIVLVAAVSDNNVIGYRGNMPWHLPADLRHFRQVTMGKPIVMGMNTAAAIGRPLPGRKNIVLSRRENLKMNGFTVVNSIDEAVIEAEGSSEVMIIGGAQIYKQFMPWADEMYLTIVHDQFLGDTFFPEFYWGDWEIVSRKEHPGDEENLSHDIYHLKKKW